MGQCPSSFLPAGFGACVRECPISGNFEQSAVNGEFQCVYTPDKSLRVTLKPIQWVPNSNPQKSGSPIASLDALKLSHPGLYPAYKAEADRVDQEIAVMMAKMNKDKKIKDAFQRLQDTENARDQAPEAYESARYTYYTLIKGDSWKTEEASRVAKTHVAPLVQKYITSKNDALQQFNNQRKTVDVVNGLKDKVLSLKDEFKYSVDTFAGQLEKVQNAVNMSRRGRNTATEVSGWAWLDVILNILIVSALIYAAMKLYPKIMRPAAPQTYTYVPVSQP